MPYFDERPKQDRADLYGRGNELSALTDGIKKGVPMILLLGLRRMGKTSLLLTALRETKIPSLCFDFRALEEKTSASYEDLFRAMEENINELIEREKTLLNYLKHVKGVKFAGIEISLSWDKKERTSIEALFRGLDKWAGDKGRKIVVALDEAQELRKLKGVRLQPVLAHVYDYLRNTTIVLTGSQVGLLYRFLQVDNPKAPLYGRSYLEIKLSCFEREAALDFLSKGFSQLGVDAPEDVLDYAVERLDGIPGWLTYFGAEAVRKGPTRKTVDRVVEKSVKLTEEELGRFFKMREIARERYSLILRKLAEGESAWGEVKRYLETKGGRTIADHVLVNLLQNLLDSGFIQKRDGKYLISDPVLTQAVRKFF